MKEVTHQMGWKIIQIEFNIMAAKGNNYVAIILKVGDKT
jgi:hypothetical protein